jgi:NAD(P)-dependent dehydrogenase (short-subunit alcohol dehydrogenase family)
MRTESVSAPVAPVTGADKSIGLETARRLAGAGYRVYLTARSSERGRAAAATAGVRFLELGGDLRGVGPSRRRLRRAGRGHLDVLVNDSRITGPVRDDPHDFTAGGMTEAVALFTRS